MATIITDALNKYSNVIRLTRGGQKEVYCGIFNDNKYALKRGKYSSITQLERIQREIDLLKSLDNVYYPHQYEFVVDIYEKEFFIVEEFIENISYSEAKTLGYFDTEQKLMIMLKNLIIGLEYIWQKRIVHRDLKPDNVLIKQDGTPIIIDLGIARHLDLETLTNPLFFQGPCTKIYAAPEQLLNQIKEIDTRTDFFSLGILILELHLGYHPFDPEYVGNEYSISENILMGKYVAPENKIGTSSEFSRVIKKLLKVEKFLRYRTSSQIIEEINKNWL